MHVRNVGGIDALGVTVMLPWPAVRRRPSRAPSHGRRETWVWRGSPSSGRPMGWVVAGPGGFTGRNNGPEPGSALPDPNRLRPRSTRRRFVHPDGTSSSTDGPRPPNADLADGEERRQRTAMVAHAQAALAQVPPPPWEGSHLARPAGDQLTTRCSISWKTDEQQAKHDGPVDDQPRSAASDRCSAELRIVSDEHDLGQDHRVDHRKPARGDVGFPEDPC